MAAGSSTASFAMDLGITGADAAGDAADELQKLQDEIKGSEDALGGMQKALRLLKGDSKGNAETIVALRKQIAAAKKDVASSTADYLKLGGSFKKTKPEIKENVEGFKQLRAAMAGGWLQAKAIWEVGKAVASATVEFAKFTVQAPDARRSEELQLEGLTKLRYGYAALAFGGYQIAADKASFLQEQLDKVSSHVAIGRDQVAGYEQQLYKMGLRSGNLQAALEGASITASAQGDAAAQTFIQMSMSAGLAGTSIRKFADDAKARLGGIVARQMLSLDVQTRKLHENLNYLFGGVKIEGFLKGLNEVTQLFSANTESGKALKLIIETIFNPFFEEGPKAGLTVKHAIQAMIIAVEDFIIALFPVRLAMKEAFADAKTTAGINDNKQLIADMSDKVKSAAHAYETLKEAVHEVKSAYDEIKSITYDVIYAFKDAGAAAYEVGDAVLEIPKSFWVVAKDINTIVNYIGTAVEDVAGNIVDGGIYIVKGIATGIKAGAHWAIEAIEGLGSSVIKAFKDKLDIHSPSRAFRYEAKYISLGAAKGVEDGAPEVRRAVGRMTPAPQEMRRAVGRMTPAPQEMRAEASGAASTQGASSPQAASQRALIEHLHLHTQEKTTESQAQDLARMFLKELQAAGVQMGAAIS